MAYVGTPSDEYRAVCVYAPQPGDPTCEQPATVHLRVASDQWGEVGLSSCDDHAPIARAAGQLLGEHPWGLVCGMPGTRWGEDTCHIDISGVEPTLTAVATADA